ncbi:MAG: hypothetical protein C0597_02320 [Marinilabiliales bacterium]|nr:MAG: hypothetical protein C0597_02320 [Marinilabiliales bacterium]
MNKTFCFLMVFLIFSSCNQNKQEKIDQEIMASLGHKYKMEFLELANFYEKQISVDSTNSEAYIGYADSYILLYVFGYLQREIAFEKVKSAYEDLMKIDSTSSDVYKLDGIINFIDWKWSESKEAFEKSIEKNPKNLNARHWYSLWLTAMGNIDKAMEQSDTIMKMDSLDNYLIARSSLLYFQYRFEEMKPLTIKGIEKDPDLPWSYDWLGMAFNGLEEHNDAIKTYLKAFELSDGTVEIGGGLGHALGDAGRIKQAKQLADFYSAAAKDNYLPPVQRSFIHIAIEDYDEAINLLEQAYKEKSWFLIFMQVEHWYDPIRDDERFINIMENMKFPN